jgi:Flp pilus assembly protein TadD
MRRDLAKVLAAAGDPVTAAGVLLAVVTVPGATEADRQLFAKLAGRRATVHRTAGAGEKARLWFDRAVVLGQRTARTLQNRGTAHRDCGDTVAAERDFRAALMLEPDHWGARMNLGLLWLEVGRAAKAVPVLERAAAEQPAALVPTIALANHWIDQGKPLQALAVLAPLSDEAQADPVVLYLTGLAQFACANNAEAYKQLQAAIKRGLADPNRLRIAVFILATHADGTVLETITPLLPPALAMLSRQWHQHAHAVALSPSVNDGERWHMLETALRGTGPVSSAAMIAEAGEMMHWAGLPGWSRLFAAADWGDAEPGDLGPQYILGLRSLQLGWFEVGWPYYEAGLALGRDSRLEPLSVTCPDWDGRPLDTGTLWVRGEQGVGDEILFAGALHGLKAQAEQVLVTVDSRLKRLLARAHPDLVIEDRATPHAELMEIYAPVATVPIGSLPLRTGGFGPSKAPSSHQPTLAVEPDAVAHARTRLRLVRQDRPAIGFAWAGGARWVRGMRSVPLELWQPLLAHTNIDWVSVQYGEASRDLGQLPARLLDRIKQDLAVDFNADLDGAAAVLRGLDLVITVSNANAHLAAALGCPCWVLVPRFTDWRWTEGDHYSRWYPDVRIFRQDQPFDWTAPMAALAEALAVWLGHVR